MRGEESQGGPRGPKEVHVRLTEGALRSLEAGREAHTALVFRVQGRMGLALEGEAWVALGLILAKDGSKNAWELLEVLNTASGEFVKAELGHLFRDLGGEAPPEGGA